jgi:hypothetical protein
VVWPPCSISEFISSRSRHILHPRCVLYYITPVLTVNYGLKGSAVAVEHIFSGGRDTISLRRASLKPETIHVLMLVKKKLHLEREKSKGIIRRN